jgi:IgGFc binding protein
MLRASKSSLGLAVVTFIMLPAASVAGWSCGGGETHGSTFGGGGDNNSGSLHTTGPNMGSGGSFAGSMSTSSMMTSSGPGGDPKTCAQAAQFHTYIGCDFWPTVMGNMVWSIFDYAVVVANTGMTPANVTVQRNGTTVGSSTVMPNSLGTIYLPWIPELKGQDTDCMGSVMPGVNTLSASVSSPGGAYHLTTDVPVTVYQFSALEYAGDNTKGGPPGKDWSSCPGPMCGLGCFSYSNDASLLLPSTAMTGNYRVFGHEGWVNNGQPILGPDVGITATADNTTVRVTLSPTGHVNAGSGVPDTPGGGMLTLTMNAGDVVELVGDPTGDFSGSLVAATNPVQVITGLPCVYIPSSAGYCDHIEESVFPAETLGKHYFVTKPSGPSGTPVPHWVKLYGNRDGTTLTYPSGVMPAGAPTTLSAGQVVDLGQVTDDFEIKGNHEFAMSVFLLAASIVDPGDPTMGKGDPSQSLPIAVEQYRDKYVFLAPTDYEVNFVDIIGPIGAQVTIDTVPVPSTLFTPIGSSSYAVAHLNLTGGAMGAHELTATQPVGIQVVGYGAYTSYMYPGGLNLGIIAPPPPPK